MCSRRCYGVFVGNTYEIGSGQIWLDNVTCTGDETDFVQCSHNGWGRHNCDHSQDVSISCAGRDRGQQFQTLQHQQIMAL